MSLALNVCNWLEWSWDELLGDESGKTGNQPLIFFAKEKFIQTYNNTEANVLIKAVLIKHLQEIGSTCW